MKSDRVCSAERVLKLHEHAPGRYGLEVTDAISTGVVGRRHLFGGAGLGAAILAMEQATGRPVRIASIQFARAVPVGAELDLQVSEISRGTTVSQAVVTGRLDGRPVFTSFASLSEFAESVSRQRSIIPAVPGPEQCVEIIAHAHADQDIHGGMEFRAVQGRFGIFSRAPPSVDGHVLVWVRLKDRKFDAAGLAVVSDFIPSTVSDALGIRAGGRSLDNSLRVISPCCSEWVLCDIQIEAIGFGLGHGRVQIFSSDGTLVSLGSQSFSLVQMPRTSEVAV